MFLPRCWDFVSIGIAAWFEQNELNIDDVCCSFLFKVCMTCVAHCGSIVCRQGDLQRQISGASAMDARMIRMPCAYYCVIFRNIKHITVLTFKVFKVLTVWRLLELQYASAQYASVQKLRRNLHNCDLRLISKVELSMRISCRSQGA